MNKRGDELQTQDRLMAESRQQIIILEGQLEQNQDTVSRQAKSLDEYKLKYQDSMEQATHLEGALSRLEDSLADAKVKVRLTSFTVTLTVQKSEKCKLVYIVWYGLGWSPIVTISGTPQSLILTNTEKDYCSIYLTKATLKECNNFTQ